MSGPRFGSESWEPATSVATSHGSWHGASGRRGVGAEVSYRSRTRRTPFEAECGVTFRPLDELVGRSDLLPVHLAFSGDTEGLLDARLVGSLPHGAGLVNIAPNELLDVEAVLSRCGTGSLRFATDHRDELPGEVLARARLTASVFLCPPIGYATAEADHRKFEVLVSNTEAFVTGTPTNQVTP